jgi:hypothetical protein
MRKAFLIFAAFCFVSACSAAQTFAADGAWNKSWSVSGSGTEVRVEADFGDVHVIQGAPNSVNATVTTEYWRIPADVQVTGTQNGNEVEIRVETPKYHGGGLFHWHTPKVDIELEVPPHSQLDLHTGFGDIHGENLQATARVDTGFGGIRFPGFSGELTGDTGFGDVRADGRFDRLQLKTGFGSIRADIDSGSKMSEDWRLESGFGSVHVLLPSDLNADINASSGFGHVSTDVPLTLSETSSHSSVRGKLGAGGFPLELSTGFGSVHIGRT